MLSDKEKENLLVVMSRFYEWKKSQSLQSLQKSQSLQSLQKSQSLQSSDPNMETFKKLKKHKLNFGSWKNIYDEIQESEKYIDDLKTDIILLKNNVLYNYEDKDKAIQKFVSMQKELVKENDRLKSMFDHYFTNVEMIEKETELLKLQKIYEENLVSYKNKMKLASTSDAKRKQTLIKEAVKLSIFLTNLSEKIRETKYQTVEFEKEKGIKVRQIALDRQFRVYKNPSTIHIE